MSQAVPPAADGRQVHQEREAARFTAAEQPHEWRETLDDGTGTQMEDVKDILALFDQEIQRITDLTLLARIRELVVCPYPVEREWDYGAPNEKFTCWTVLEHAPSNTGIAYCAQGFGPSFPWGLIFLSGRHMNIGMDSGWFASLEGAMRDSQAWEGPNPDGYESK